MSKKNKSQRMQRNIRQVARRGVVGAALLARDRKTRHQYKKKLGGRVSPKSQSINMERCSANLLKAAVDPFAISDEVCIPYGNGRPSQKIRCLIRGVGTIGSGSHGFVCVAPTCCIDNRFVFYSSSTYAGTTMTANSGTAGVVAVHPHAGYAVTYYDGIGSVNQFRLCAVGLRVKYTGTELNKSGLVYGLATPDRASMEGYTTHDMSRFAECRVDGFDRKWTTLGAISQDDIEWEYSPANGVQDLTSALYPWNRSLTASNNGVPVMGFMVTGVAGQSFAFEAVVYSETIGPSVQGLTSRNTVDIDGLGKAVAIANKVPAMLASGIRQATAVAAAITEVATMTKDVVAVTTAMFT